MWKIATRCLVLSSDLNKDIDEKFVGYRGQAESIRDTCSRDPANSKFEIWVQVVLFFFTKRKKMVQVTKKKKNTEEAICTGDVLDFGPMQWLGMD